jgi:hypothetical protein
MTEEAQRQVLLTATGFAAREGLAVFRKHKIGIAPLLLRAGTARLSTNRENAWRPNT